MMNTSVLDSDLLMAFVAVADHRSFTKAAAALNRTQSAVSMQIKRLEGQIDATLFLRTNASVEINAAGEKLLGYARRILALNHEAFDRLREHKVEGFARLGVMEDYGAVIVPPLLARFAAAYPLIRVEMETGLTSGMTKRLGSSFDLVIAMHPEGQGGGEFLRREQAVWAAGFSHPIEEMEALPVALYPQGCLFRQWAIAALDAAQRRWRLAFVSHSLSAVEQIAAEGLAVTVVKSGVFPPRLRSLSVSDGMPALPGADIRLHRASNLSRAASLLADHLASTMSKPD
jgi:DNA-binding transcriptional LysR family regulator